MEIFHWIEVNAPEEQGPQSMTQAKVALLPETHGVTSLAIGSIKIYSSNSYQSSDFTQLSTVDTANYQASIHGMSSYWVLIATEANKDRK